MKKAIFFLLAVSSIATLTYANRDEGLQPANGFFFPLGDSQAGKEAFKRLKCDACHWVQNELNLSLPVAEKVGPILSAKQADYSVGWLADSIVTPSHILAWDADGKGENGELSRMGNFTEVMTVREMIDIVAYLRSVDSLESRHSS